MQKASFAALSLASALGLAALLPIGCGTGPADGLFEENGPPGTGGAGGKGGSTASGSTTGTGGAGGIGVGGSGQSSSSTGNPSSSSSTSGGGGMGSGGMGGTGGTGGQPMAGTVPCAGDSMCSLANGGACCWWEEDDSGSCVQAGGFCDQSQNGGQTRIECQSEAQCGAGEKCCGDREGGNFGTYYTQLTCQTECSDITLCDTEGEMGPDCPMMFCPNQGEQQTVCGQSGLLPFGFLVCGCP